MGVELEGLRTGKGFIKEQERLGKAFRGWEEMAAEEVPLRGWRGCEGGAGGEKSRWQQGLARKTCSRSLPGTEILGFPLQSAGRLV